LQITVANICWTAGGNTSHHDRVPQKLPQQNRLTLKYEKFLDLIFQSGSEFLLFPGFRHFREHLAIFPTLDFWQPLEDVETPTH
jgi:hypothetical protein